MTLLTRLKADALAARKMRDTLTALSLTTQIGELETAAKNTGHQPTDAEVVAAIKKTIKGIEETLKLVVHDAEASALGLRELELFESYLPRQLSEAELGTVIDGYISAGAKNVGEVMKLLKADHAGTYDGALASSIIKGKF